MRRIQPFVFNNRSPQGSDEQDPLRMAKLYASWRTYKGNGVLMFEKLNPIVFQPNPPNIHRDGSYDAFCKYKELIKGMTLEGFSEYKSVFRYGLSRSHPMNCFKVMVF